MSTYKLSKLVCKSLNISFKKFLVGFLRRTKAKFDFEVLKIHLPTKKFRGTQFEINVTYEFNFISSKNMMRNEPTKTKPVAFTTQGKISQRNKFLECNIKIK